MDTAERANEGPEASKRNDVHNCHEQKAGFGLEGPSLNDYSCVRKNRRHHHTGDALSGPIYATSPKSS